jgi:hypothetical protein
MGMSVADYSVPHRFKPVINNGENQNINVVDDVKFVKYTVNIPDMKTYQRIIFSASGEFKGQISWLDYENKKNTMVLNDLTKYTKFENDNIYKAVEIGNKIGHYINLSSISSNDDQIGFFREINQVCKKNNKFIDELDINDFSLKEIVYYNRKHGMKLFNSTLTSAQKNINELIAATSAGGGYKMLSATRTISATAGYTPSQGGCGGAHDDDHQPINRDISMCSICYSEIREYVFSCGHCYSCKDCAEKLLISAPKNKCSYCKTDVTWIRKITMTEDQKNKDHYFKCITKDCYNIASLVSKCDSLNEDDSGYHLTYCNKCSPANKHKKAKIVKKCFCEKDITMIVEKVFFN